MAHDILVSQLYIQDRNRISSTTRFPRRATWHYFEAYLPDYFMCCSNVVKDAITTDINDLMQQFWRTSTDGLDIFCPAICRLREILQVCLDIMFLLGPPLTFTHRYCSIAGTITSVTLMKNILLQRSLINYFSNPDIWTTCSSLYLVSQCRRV